MNRVKLPEVCELIMGQSPDSASYNKSKEGLPFYQGNADFGPKYPTPTVWCSAPKKIAKNNDILISVRAPIGDLNFANEECCIGRGLAALRVKDYSKYSKEYLFAFLKSTARELQRKGIGSTFTAIGKSVLENLEINVPSLPEQQKIAAHLDSIQSAIDNKKQQLQQLDELVKSKFVEMFGENPVESGKWKVETLGNLCTKLNDGTHHSPENYDVGDFKYITAKNIKEDGYDFSDLKFVTKQVHETIFSRCNPEYGDVLYIKDGATTGIAMINTLREEFSLLSSVALLKYKRDIINGFYLCAILNDKNMYYKIREGMGGAAITRLTIEKIKNIKISVPPIELQNDFATFVQKIDTVKSIIKTQLNDLNELLESKMDEYFGE